MLRRRLRTPSSASKKAQHDSDHLHRVCARLRHADLRSPPTVPPAVCPPVRTWTQTFQNQVAAEIEAAPNSALAQVAIQSIGDRDVARASPLPSARRNHRAGNGRGWTPIKRGWITLGVGGFLLTAGLTIGGCVWAVARIKEDVDVNKIAEERTRDE